MVVEAYKKAEERLAAKAAKEFASAAIDTDPPEDNRDKLF
jgi:hypothetical protein